MAEYFFLTTLFPDVEPEIPLEMSVRELLVLCRDNLTEKDWQDLTCLLREIDLNNLRAFLSDREIDPRGLLTKEDLEESLAGNNGLPEYVSDFFSRYDKREERLHRFEELLASYYREETKNFHSEHFLNEWLDFERQLRLTLTAMRAKKQGKNLAEVFLFEDPMDDEVQYFLAQKDAEEIEPKERFAEVKAILEEQNPIVSARKLLDFRLSELRSMIGFDHFSIKRVLAYFVEVLLIENWQKLNREAGKQILASIVR